MEKSCNILRLDSSARYPGSVSRHLTDQLVARLLRAFPNANLKTRDLAEGLPLPTEAFVDGTLYAMQNPNAVMQAAIQHSNEMVTELLAADVVVLGLPLYNWSVPSAFKAYVDQITRLGVTFEYLSDGTTRGKLRAQHVYILFTSGGTSIGSEKDFATPYLTFLWKKLGVPNVHYIEASGLLGNPEEITRNARTRIDQMALPVFA